MSKIVYVLGCFAVLAGLTVSASAATWTNGKGNQLWGEPNNWLGNVLPTLADTSAVSTAGGWPVINAGTDAVSFQIRVGGTGALSTLTMNGGTLTVGEWLMIGSEVASNIGELDMNGGTINLNANLANNGHLWVGFTGTGTINMTGGTINVPNKFGLSFSGGTSHVNLSGGTISAQSFTMMEGGSGSATFDISGTGKLIVNGNQTGTGTVISNYISKGWFTAYNGLGIVTMVYDTVTLKTTITGVMDNTKARGASPLPGAVDVAPYVVLKRAPGDTSTAQNLYFGTDLNAVTNATPADPCGIYVGQIAHSVTSYDPPNLKLKGTYYWRVDQVADPNIYKGTVWQFTVADNALVDDFEMYADSSAMLASWTSNGSAALSLATSNGHDKANSLKLDYNNAAAPYYSEAQNTAVNPDWTIAGVTGLELWYKGDAANAAAQMYAALEDNNGHPIALIVNTDPNAAKASTWQPWRIVPGSFSGVNLANVKKFYIGFGDRVNPAAGGAGTVYIDDIRLYPARCITRPDADLNNDCVVNFADFAIFAGNWMAQTQGY